MNTEIKNAIQAADSEAQYDESAKRLLAQKYVLAHSLVRTVEEFQGMEIEKVVSLIEGDPYISKVPVASGLTNKDRNVEGKRIVGLNTEAGEKNEGLVRFDIIFYVRMRNGLAHAYGHFPRPSGPRSPARQGHIKRPVLRLAEPSFLRPANQCC